MKIKKQILILFVLFLVYFNLQSQTLLHYTSIVDRINIAGVESSKAFDKNGVVVSAKQYHPLAIAQFGILAYYYFEATKDSSYYYKCVNQFIYFKDSTKVNSLFDGKGIGLPYNFKFWDLKVPWYSGMTQGYAISYLLRYYELTKDEEVLPIIKKIAYVLLQRQEIGGTISTTKEGYTWIEEYPNSKRSPQVLNGYINGLIGLKEYTMFFPKDTLAKRIFEETYVGLINSLEYFDSNTWSYYNRAKKPLSNSYLRYQIYEMKHLYAIFNDEIFDKQMRIWGVLSYKKYTLSKSKAYKFPKHEISVPVSQIDENKYGVKPLKGLLNLKQEDLVLSEYSRLKHVKRSLKKIRKRAKHSIYSFSIAKSMNANYVEIYFDNHKEHNMDLLGVYSKIDGKKIHSVEYTVTFLSNKVLIAFDEIDINNVVFKFKKIASKDRKQIHFMFYNTNRIKPPFFAHQRSKIYNLKKDQKYDVSLEKYNVEKAVVFYRLLYNKNNSNSGKWKAKNTVLDQFIPKHDGFYQFMVVYNYKNPLSMINKLEIGNKRTLDSKK